ncbi:MAG TPA: histidine kinase [Bacteroidia bacterium]|nr:histidine kinase [Bacteroidia bacterium]
MSKYYIKNKTLIIVAGSFFAWTITHAFILQQLFLPWQAAFTDAFIANAFIALTGFTINSTFKFYNPGNSGIWYRIIYLLLMSIACIWLTTLTLNYLVIEPAYYPRFYKSVLPVRYMFTLLMLAFIMVVHWLLINNKQHEAHLKRKEEAELLLRDAELAKLRQQLQPHFLFNSLNSISALAGSKPETARKMIQQLSDFLRSTLKKDDQKPVPLSEELAQIELYLEIEKVRFGNRLRTNLDIHPNALTCLLPPLLLQPLIENAIKFGLYDTLDEVTITVSAETKDSYLQLAITNPFDAATTNANLGTGFGLSAVSRRLYLLFGRNDLLQTTTQYNLFTATLQIPLYV